LGNGAEYIVSAYPVSVQGWDVVFVAIVVLVLGAISSYIPVRKLTN
jgi:ABC-type antimicrobial peptide transport system permease subunit